jgi:Ca-activated chloride channel family protein
VSEYKTPNSIDRQLRNVALPPSLLPRLRDIAAMGDAELDFLIGAVPLPADTLDRLRSIGSLCDVDIDAELRDVELPRGMRYRVERSMRWQAQRARLIGWAVAASLLAIVAGVAYWSSVGGRVAQQGGNPMRVDFHKGNLADADLQRQENRRQELAGTNARPSESPVRTAPTGQTPAVPARAVPIPTAPTVAVPTPAGQAPTVPAPKELVRSGIPSTQPVRNGTDSPHQSPAPRHEYPFATPLAPQPASLKVIEAPLARGVSGPRVAGYDLIGELRGRHPFVVPALNAALRESRVPIWTDTSSYELAGRMTERGQLPPPSQIHTEDFLAAMDFRFPLPADAPLGIRTAAGPAPWGPAGMSLLQVGVQAARLSIGRSATHLTLVVDASAAMRDAGRWDAVRRAVAQLVEQLGPRDRMSLVFFKGEATIKVRQANQAEMGPILSAWNNVQPAGIADMAAGLEAAAAVARQPLAGAGAGENKMVLIADGLDSVDDRSLRHLRTLLRDTVVAGVKWTMIGLDDDSTLSPTWDDLAEIGGHAVHHASTPDDLFQRLSETLAGRSQVVAANVEMKVTFNPKAVNRYRLIGHEPNVAGGLAGASLQKDLRSLQAATALYEVELKPDGPTEVGSVEVSWLDPVSETPRHIRQPISRLQFVASWRECALPLQTAALAALAAEVLRNPNALPTTSRVLDQAAELAAELNPALTDRPGILRLERLIRQARTAKPARSSVLPAGS